MRTTVAALAAVVLTCAACSETSPTGATSQSPESTAGGPEISGTGYTYVVPEDWGPPSEGPPSGQEVDSFAVALEDDDGFRDNVNVILSPAGEVTPEQAEVSGAEELEASGATEVSVQDRVQIAGSEAAHLSAVGEVGGTAFALEQYFPTEDGQTYVVTFSFNGDVAASTRAEVTDAVLDSWAWTEQN